MKKIIWEERFDGMWDSLKSVSDTMPDGGAYVDDLIVKDFIHSVVEEARKECPRGALHLKGYDDGKKTERKQIEKEIIKKIKTWEKTVECPLYVCCQDCYELSIDDVLDLLKKETK